MKSVLFILLVAASVPALEGTVLPPDSKAGREIVLGMSSVLSGPAADIGNDMRQGITAGLERANRAGGVRGRMLRLIALDDGYEPRRTAPNMRQLLEKDNVLAIIGNVGTPTAIAAIPIAIEQKTLFFAAFSGAGVLRKTPPDRYVINYRASYAEETGAIIDALIGAGLKPEEISFFTQRDSYGDAGFSGAVEALKRHGLIDEKQILHVRYERNTLAVEDALANLLYAERLTRAVVMVGAYGPCAKFIKLIKEAGSVGAVRVKKVFINVSFVGSRSLAKELRELDEPVIVTQVVPHPADRTLPIVRDYLLDLAALDPAAQPEFSSLEGYIAARIFVKALESVKGDLTRETIIDALEGLGNFELGLGEPMGYGPADHEACKKVWPTILKDGAFVPFDWKNIGGLLAKRPQP